MKTLTRVITFAFVAGINVALITMIARFFDGTSPESVALSFLTSRMGLSSSWHWLALIGMAGAVYAGCLMAGAVKREINIPLSPEKPKNILTDEEEKQKNEDVFLGVGDDGEMVYLSDFESEEGANEWAFEEARGVL